MCYLMWCIEILFDDVYWRDDVIFKWYNYGDGDQLLMWIICIYLWLMMFYVFNYDSIHYDYSIFLFWLYTHPNCRLDACAFL